MSLTKKHFKELAAILARHATSHELVTEIADFCASQNPNFDRMEFLTAIGVQITDKPQPRRIYVNAGSYAYEPFASVHRTIEDAMVQWHIDMKLHMDPVAQATPGTSEWFTALNDAYEHDDWKGYEIYAIDVDNVSVIEVPHSRHSEIDWSDVTRRVRALSPDDV